MSVVGGGCGNNALQNPGNRMKDAVLVEGFVPRNAGVRERGDHALDGVYDERRRTKPEVCERGREIGLREKYRIESVLPARHRHSHVRRGMVSAMEAPEPRELMVQAVVPILGKVVSDADDEESPPERHPRESASH